MVPARGGLAGDRLRRGRPHRLVLIITIPFGIAAFRLAGFVVWPFGRTAVWRREAGVWSVLGNVVWVLLLGWELALLHLVAGLVLCVTVIGIPFGIACWKMVPLALLPLGREVVPIEQADRDPYAIPIGGHPTTQTSS